MKKFDEIDKNVIISTSPAGDQSSDFINILDMMEDVDEVDSNQDTIPILPLRNTVLFPHVIIPISVGREKSLKLIQDAYKTKNKTIGVVAQINSEDVSPAFIDLYRVGTVAKIIKILNMPDGSITAIIQGRRRFQLDSLVQLEPYFIAKISPFNSKKKYNENKLTALMPTIKSLATQVIEKSPNIPNEVSMALHNVGNNNFIVNYVSNYLDLSVSEKQQLLETKDLTDQAHKIIEYLSEEIRMLEVKNQIENKVKVDIDKQQREFILNQQLKTIQEELGGASNVQDIDELKEKAKTKKWNDKVKETFEKELLKLQRMNPMAMEYSIQKNYLDTIIGLPWNEYTEDDFNQKKAKKVLDKDHYGLDTVKDRILEYLAVLQLKNDMRSPILCLVGPPGVGKTSLGKSIADAISRKYIRMSLGGLRDEAEIRGHRKTYIGAMPGRVIQSILKAKSSNPVFILDEIDKVGGMSVNGDPSSALLELLDPEQNSTFYDNYVEMEYDLSRVMFIATANTLNTIHPALRDRMEIIDISGYLHDEKREIAIRHLIPKQLEEHGVKKTQIEFPNEVIDIIINNYTRESGVRLLEKQITKVIRHRAKQIVSGDKFKKKLSEKDITEILGHPKFSREDALTEPTTGVVTGLAWTAVGGEILFIEASAYPGEGKLSITGNLGDVMKESASVAFEYIKSNALKLGLDYNEIKNKNLHLHVPEGATPKDGPSAGITMFTALYSILSGKKVRNDLAMTGEITLRGTVLPVGGIKEKILAAKRAHIKTIILSEENRGDIEEIKKDYLEGLKFIYVKNMNDILNIAIMK
ncbi:MAG: endopeptidase La [Bacteroidales bacterium]|jgi:ATP-dependent Lon protease|nr:endopeptidase La [Bacteroidales bacterium]